MIDLVELMSDGNTDRMNVGFRRMYDEGDERQPVFEDNTYESFYHRRRVQVLDNIYFKETPPVRKSA